MKGKKAISVDREALDSIHRKLAAFMDSLPPEEKEGIAIILSRAASATSQMAGDLDAYLARGIAESNRPTLRLIARAIDGKSTIQDASGPPWAYVVWTYNSK